MNRLGSATDIFFTLDSGNRRRGANYCDSNTSDEVEKSLHPLSELNKEHSFFTRFPNTGKHRRLCSAGLLLDVLVHETLVELVPQAVVDKGGLLLVRLGAAAILEDDIVVPAALDAHVRLGGVRVLLLEQRIAGQNVLHADSLLLLSPLSFLQ